MNTGNNGPAGQPASGPGETANTTTPTIEHPDAELLRLKREIEDASAAGNTAATDEEAEPFLDLATKLRHELAEIPAHTLDGIIAKFDDYRRIHEGGATSVWDEDLLRTIREGLERLKPSADAALASLWQEYRQNSKEWGVADDDTEIEDKCAKRADEIERRIIDTPSESALGLAIKLRIAVDNTPEDKEPEFNDQRAMLAVLDDVDRLAGFTEPRRVWGASLTAPAPRAGDVIGKTEWLAMFQEYRDRMGDEAAAVRANQRDTDAETRATEEAAEATLSVEHRIAEAEADGLLSLAVKLAVLWNNSIADTAGSHDDNALLVGSALDYLVKQTGIDPYVTYDRNCKPIRELAKIRDAS